MANTYCIEFADSKRSSIRLAGETRTGNVDPEWDHVIFWRFFFKIFVTEVAELGPIDGCRNEAPEKKREKEKKSPCIFAQKPRSRSGRRHVIDRFSVLFVCLFVFGLRQFLCFLLRWIAMRRRTHTDTSWGHGYRKISFLASSLVQHHHHHHIYHHHHYHHHRY